MDVGIGINVGYSTKELLSRLKDSKNKRAPNQTINSKENKLREAQEIIIEQQMEGGTDEIIGCAIRRFKFEQVIIKKQVLYDILNDKIVHPDYLYAKWIIEDKLINLLSSKKNKILVYRNNQGELQIDLPLFNREWQWRLFQMGDYDIFIHYKNKYHIGENRVERVEQFTTHKFFNWLKWLPCDNVFPWITVIVFIITIPVNMYLPSELFIYFWSSHLVIWIPLFVGSIIIISCILGKKCLDFSNCLEDFDTNTSVKTILIMKVVNLLLLQLLIIFTLVIVFVESFWEKNLFLCFVIVIMSITIYQLVALALITIFCMTERYEIRELWYLFMDKNRDVSRYYRRIQWFIGSCVLNDGGSMRRDSMYEYVL